MMQETEQQANESLNSHFAALAKLEKYLPRLVGVGERVCSIIEGYCKDRQLDPSKTRLGDVKWHGDGVIAFAFYPQGLPDPMFGANTKPETFVALKRMDKQFPQVVSMLFAVASQLVGQINRHHYETSRLTFSTPAFFIFSHKQELHPAIRFTVLYNKRPVCPSEVKA